jgi:uncharacterized membrane protein YeiH
VDPAFRYAAEFHIPPILEFIAIILFAITGALSAAKRGYDWIGALSIALVTGCGGGLIRDTLLNVRPVFLEHEAYIWAVFAAVLLSIYLFPLVSRMYWIFLVSDALGLAMYAVIGTQKSLNSGLGISAAILIGTLNAIGGGLIRDVLTREEARVLKPGQWYAGIAFGGSVLFCLLSRLLHVRPATAGTLVVLVAFTARILAYRYDLKTRAVRPVGFDAHHS